METKVPFSWSGYILNGATPPLPGTALIGRSAELQSWPQKHRLGVVTPTTGAYRRESPRRSGDASAARMCGGPG